MIQSFPVLFLPSGVNSSNLNNQKLLIITSESTKETIKFAKIPNLKVRTVSALIKFRLKKTKIVKQISERPFESEMGSQFTLKVFQNSISGEKHYALVKNLIDVNEPVLVRMHRLDVTKDIFEEKNIFGSEIKSAFQLIEKNLSLIHI